MMLSLSRNIGMQLLTELKIENNSITSSLKTILNNFDIEDLFINEPPIDEVIGKVLIKKDYDI